MRAIMEKKMYNNLKQLRVIGCLGVNKVEYVGSTVASTVKIM